MKKLFALLILTVLMLLVFANVALADSSIFSLPGYVRPTISNYAKNCTENNKLCDVIRPDVLEVAESDKKIFTLEGSAFYGALWNVAFNAPLTIKAKDGYTINRIEVVVTDNKNYSELSIEKGTKGEIVENPFSSADDAKTDYVASFDDIDANSVTFSVKGDNNDNIAISITEVIVYYSEPLTDSAFSGGPLWIIFGVAAAAVVTAVVEIIAKKRRNKNERNLF